MGGMRLPTWLKTQPAPRHAKRSQGNAEPGAYPSFMDAPPALAVRPPATRGELVNARSATQLSSVYRAIDVIETAAAQLTLDAWNNTGLVTTDIKPLIASPDPTMSQSAFTVETVSSLVMTGNAYWKVNRYRDGSVSGVTLLDPSTCTPYIDPETGARFTDWNGKQLTAVDLVHLRKMVIPGLAPGLGPIQACARELGAAIDMSRYATQFTGAGTVPTGILTSEKPSTPEQAQNVVKTWGIARSQSATAFLPDGIKYTPIQFKPSDMQFLETRNFDTLAVARLFGIPARLMNAAPEGGTMTYANLQDDDISFMRWTVMSYLRPIEDALTTLLPRGWSVRYNLDALLRPSTKDRYEALATAIGCGLMTDKEARQTEGLEKS